MLISKEIEKKVTRLPEGVFIFISDFTGKYNYEVARKVLQRLYKKKLLIRLTRGVYYKPKESKKFGTIYPTAEQIAEAIAKRDKARIIPTGSYALYKLGLSTQIPMNVVYLTDGSARKVEVGKQKITFRKTSPKNLTVNHSLSNLIIQGLKKLGEKNITEQTEKKLKEIINKSGEAKKIKREIKNAPVWIQKLTLQIIKEIEK